MFLFVLGVAGLSLLITYAWWVRFRVISFRQDIYQLRGVLFDKALSLNALDDPAYRKLREHLNSIATVAEWITIPIVARYLNSGVGPKVLPQSSSPVVQELLDNTIEECASRLQHYLMFETLTGLISWPIVVGSSIQDTVSEQARKWVRRWVVSSRPKELVDWVPLSGRLGLFW